MFTNDTGPASVTDGGETTTDDRVVETDAEPGRARRRRARDGLTVMLRPRFTPAERIEVDAAAASAGMSTSRFCAEAALAAARDAPMRLSVVQDREALARLQRQLFAARTADWVQSGAAAWKPRPVRRVYIPKAKGKRPLGIPTDTANCAVGFVWSGFGIVRHCDASVSSAVRSAVTGVV